MSSDEEKNAKSFSLFKKLFDKLKKDKKSMLIILLGISGMLLILFSGTDTVNADATEETSAGVYSQENISAQVKKLISDINGAGKTEVVITYENDFETVYAVNTDEKYSGNDIHTDREYIITDDETGLILKVLYPKVRGVAVVCQGGDDPVVKQKIYSVLSALFDISSNKISVVDMY